MPTDELETRRSASDTGELTRRRARWALLATSLGFAVVQLDVSLLNHAYRDRRNGRMRSACGRPAPRWRCRPDR
jgi:hypothetical protein